MANYEQCQAPFVAAYTKPQTSLTIASSAFCLVLLLVIDRQQALSVLTSGDIGWFVLLGLAGAGVSFILYVTGIKWTSPSVASMVAMAEPVTASLFGVFLLGEHLTLVQFTGMAIILMTIILLSVRQASETWQGTVNTLIQTQSKLILMISFATLTVAILSEQKK